MQKLFLADKSLWFAVFFALLPLIIHLIRRRRAPTVVFAPTRLLIATQKKLRSRHLLREILLLISRMILLGCVGFAMARLSEGLPPPQDHTPQTTQTSHQAVAFIIDASASMQRIDGNSTLASKAQEIVERRISSFLPDDVGVIISAAGRASLLSNPTPDKSILIEKLKQFHADYGSADISGALAIALDKLANLTADKKQVVLISDFLMNNKAELAKASVPESVELELIPLLSEDAQTDFGINSAELKSQSMGNFNISADIYAVPQAKENLFPSVTLYSDESEITEVTAVGGKNGFKANLIYSPPKSGGFTLLTLKLAGDPLSLNNEYFLPLVNPKPIKVLVINGSPSWVDFKDETFFAAQAINSTENSWLQNLKVIEPSELPAINIDEYQAIILANLSSLGVEQLTRVRRFVNSGGGLILSAGNNINEMVYDAEWGDYLPGTIRGVSETKKVPVSSFETQHPIFSIFDVSTSESIKAISCEKYLFMSPARSGDHSIAFFDDGSPFIILGNREQGHVAMIATTLDRDWCNFALTPAFLPVLERLILYVTGQLENVSPKNYVIGTPMFFDMGQSQEIRVKLPSGVEHSFTRNSNLEHETVMINAEENTRPGTVSVYRKNIGAASWKLSPAETTIISISPEELSGPIMNPAMIQELLKGKSVKIMALNKEETETFAKPLWHLFLLAAIIALLFESFIAGYPSVIKGLRNLFD